MSAAPLKNKFAVKYGDDAMGAFLHVRCAASHKGHWVYASRKRGMKLAEWVVEHLNAAALRECGESPSKRRPR